MCRSTERTIEHNERVLIVSLVLAFVGLPMLLAGAAIYAPTNHLMNDDDDYVLEINSISVMSTGGALLLPALIMFAVAVARYPVLLNKYFSWGSLRSDVLYMAYSFAALCCWLALAFTTMLLGHSRPASCTTSRCAYGTMSIVLISTSPIPILAFFFFTVRVLRRVSAPPASEPPLLDDTD